MTVAVYLLCGQHMGWPLDSTGFSRDHNAADEQRSSVVLAATLAFIVLAGLVPAIHAFLAVDGVYSEDVGGRDKPGQGGSRMTLNPKSASER